MGKEILGFEVMIASSMICYVSVLLAFYIICLESTLFALSLFAEAVLYMYICMYPLEVLRGKYWGCGVFLLLCGPIYSILVNVCKIINHTAILMVPVATINSDHGTIWALVNIICGVSDILPRLCFLL